MWLDGVFRGASIRGRGRPRIRRNQALIVTAVLPIRFLHMRTCCGRAPRNSSHLRNVHLSFTASSSFSGTRLSTAERMLFINESLRRARKSVQPIERIGCGGGFEPPIFGL
jgi:hypothetical protein